MKNFEFIILIVISLLDRLTGLAIIFLTFSHIF